MLALFGSTPTGTILGASYLDAIPDIATSQKQSRLKPTQRSDARHTGKCGR